jgi:hypothetical protein
MDSIDFRKDDVVTVEDTELSISKIARASNHRNIARFFDVFLNVMSRDGYRTGKDSGSLLRTTHRTLQRSFICWCIGALCGIAEQEHSDARNAEALVSAKKISKMVENGEINMGPFV